MNKKMINIWKKHEKKLRIKSQEIMKKCEKDYDNFDLDSRVGNFYLGLYAAHIYIKADKIKRRIEFLQKHHCLCGAN